VQSTTLGQLAGEFGFALHGPPEARISGLATLATAGPEDISFLANPSYRSILSETRAGAVILAEEDLAACPVPALVSPDPYLDWARIAEWLRPPEPVSPGIHPTASIHETSSIHPDASIGPQAVVGPGCVVGQDVQVGPGCVLDRDVRLGDGTRLVAQVYLGPDVTLGQRVVVHPGAVIGADGFGLAMDSGHWHKVPQLGGVRIGDDCEIGANTTIDRGAIDDTVLEEDVRLDNQVQIAHNVRIGAHTAIAGCVGVAGSTRIGRYCMIAGASGIGGHLEICDKVVITAMSTVLDSIDRPGQYGSGIPARSHREWQRILVRLGHIDEYARRLMGLEKKDRESGKS